MIHRLNIGCGDIMYSPYSYSLLMNNSNRVQCTGQQQQMIVQKEQQNINKFLQSKECIFALSPIDYPNELQQMAILSYLYLKNIFDTLQEPLKQLQDISFKNNKNLEKVIVGLVYRTFLHPQEQESMFGYAKQLGSSALDLYCEFFIKLLVGEVDKLHDEALMVVPQIYHQLMRYNLFVEKLTISILRTINYIDLSERGLTYSYSVIEVLADIVTIIDLQGKGGDEAGGGVGRLIFIKVLRVLTSIFLFEEEQEIKVFIQKCKNLLLCLWRINKKQCLFCGAEAFRFLQDFLSHPQLNTLFNQYKSQYYANQKHLLLLPKHKYDQLLAINIPIQVFDAIGFSMNSTSPQIYYQMNWFQTSNRENKNFEMILVDILRYMIKIVEHANAFTFIQWILMYSQKNKETSIMFKHLCLQAIFFDWFFNESLEDVQIIKRTETGLCVLKFYQSNPTKFQQMLEFILFQQVKEVNSGLARVRDNLQKIFRLGDEKGLFKIHHVLNSNIIDGVLKEELRVFMYGKEEVEGENRKDEYSSLLLDRIESHESEDLWKEESQEMYVESPKPQIRMQVEQDISSDSLSLTVQKYFYQENKQKLLLLLQSPTTINYTLYLDHLITSCKKVYKDKEIYQKFIREASKILYIVFQSHWESFYSIEDTPPEQSVILVHITRLEKGWGSTDLAMDIHRKILKGVMKTFPIGVFALYFTFLMMVPTTKAYCQQINSFITAGENKKKLQKCLGKLIENQTTLKTIQMKAFKYKVLIE